MSTYADLVNEERSQAGLSNGYADAASGTPNLTPDGAASLTAQWKGYLQDTPGVIPWYNPLGWIASTQENDVVSQLQDGLNSLNLQTDATGSYLADPQTAWSRIFSAASYLDSVGKSPGYIPTLNLAGDLADSAANLAGQAAAAVKPALDVGKYVVMGIVGVLVLVAIIKLS